ncbi:MAG: HD domain-containing protein [Spirosomataceae bacterium]
MTNKRKIFNDPVYGFITIPSDFIFEVIEHPYFQRLRRIKQLGMSELVYPGAFHTRFSHALGAMHLMTEALATLESKGLQISDAETEAAQLAILLHDIGHGPFSHVLEFTLLDNVNHEFISEVIMERLNDAFGGRLKMAIEIFNDQYHRPFFHQLVSSQLDMDRMDYLNRDSFYTGVVEGKIGAERIIKMLNVVNNELVVEEKGLLSVENFLVARRLMYWQVYLHKTAISAETMLIKLFERIKELNISDNAVVLPYPLSVFLKNDISKEQFLNDENNLNAFLKLDDYDIWGLIKQLQHSPDYVLSLLATGLVDRNLFKIMLDVDLDTESVLAEKTAELNAKKIDPGFLKYLVSGGSISNSGYIAKSSNIKILMKNGTILDISEASDLPTIKAMSNIVKKNYLCYANDVYLP